jgi:hypothetical protein
MRHDNQLQRTISEQEPAMVPAALSWFRRDVAFVFGWRNTLILGGGVGVMLVMITLLLEPFGTDRDEGAWRTLRIAGYGVCVAAPFLFFHGLDRLVYAWQGRRWRVYNEISSRALLTLAVFGCCWYYNVRFINHVAPTWQDWIDYVVHIAAPHAVVLAPSLALLAFLLIDRWPEPAPGAGQPLVVRGRNRDEVLRLMPAEFVFAEAVQNYVSIYRRCDGRLERHLIRAPLSGVERQVPGAIRIHRSYLVNPQHVVRVEGNARKREAVVDGLERRLPISPDFDPTVFG